MNETGNNDDRGSTRLFIAMVAAGILLLVQGAIIAYKDAEMVILAMGVLSLVVTAAAWALAGRDGLSGGGNRDLLEKQIRLLDAISERMLISDEAKHIAFREKDRDALRQAIQDDIAKSDYDAAMVLVHSMADTYGYREEAEHFRQKILEAQATKRQAMIQAAINQIDQTLARHDWVAARADIDRMMRIYPEYPQIKALPERMREAREMYKMDLIREFKESYEREDTSRATELLTEMDRYLTPDEARPYMDMARDVLARKRENMGVQFKMAVQDRDWIAALSVGEQIIREFPNSGFATEVREMLDTLRERAANQRAAVT